MARTPLFRRFVKALQTDQSRRNFLKKSLEKSILAGIAASTPTYLASALTACAHGTAAQAGSLEGDFTSRNQGNPVIIVGGGFAGLTAAYFLNKAGFSCELYEATSRLGGRVFTLDGFNGDGQYCELGAELIDTYHVDLINLAMEVGLQIEDFAPGDKGFIDESFFFEGKLYYSEDLDAAVAPLAKRVARDFKKAFPFGMVNYKMPTVYGRKLDRTPLSEYLNRISGVPTWVRKLIEVAYLSEYGLEIEEQSTLNLLSLMDTDVSNGFRMYGQSDETKRIVGGNGKLADVLEAMIAPKVPIHRENKLVKLEQMKENGATKLAMTFESASGTKTVVSGHSVITLPYTVLRGIEGIGKLDIPTDKMASIMELGYGLNSKHMLSFNSKFWRQNDPKIKASTGTVFTDMDSQCFWETSRLQKGQKGILTNFLAGKKASGATKDARIELALSDLVKVHGDRAREQFDGAHVMMNWGKARFSLGSYACPKPGQFLTHFFKTGGVLCGGSLILAGEHCSRVSPGYMNGAVDSAKVAFKEILSRFS